MEEREKTLKALEAELPHMQEASKHLRELVENQVFWFKLTVPERQAVGQVYWKVRKHCLACGDPDP